MFYNVYRCRFTDHTWVNPIGWPTAAKARAVRLPSSICLGVVRRKAA